ncbi:class I adenylate-forming enzyme family protein [Paraburkholderia solisilvae]|uniref:Long-chain-fatty-acid--CoA ligase n=1 Tax=Paraburkholderia solisilvae TaxID=624376 RepID=A0A6J5DTS8_9BURK|nr:class I adenylate-forming enzyme family protein [Paraburkholderia solisilvae]CAB3756442.1 Long-chain-fatty-acid--CoA ligase [Paraburkholderia solisilvae]
MHIPENLGDLIDTARDPHKLALVALGDLDETEDGWRDTRITYGELDALANGVARALERRGLARGQRVAILAANCAEYVAALLGIMRAGLVATPVNFRFPQALSTFVIRDSDAQLVFCDAARLADCPADLPTVVFDTDGADGFASFVDPGAYDAVRPEPGAPAMFLYTSGSTGKPKGVMLSHDSHLWVARTRAAAQPPQAHRFLVAAPLYHMNALTLVLMSLHGHGTVVLLPQFKARAYISAIERYGVTWLTSVPPMIAMMLREPDLLARTDLASVRFIRMGSAPVGESLLAQIAAVFPNAKVTNVYGTTEGGPIVFGPHPDGLEPPPLSVGYPHPEVRVRLLDVPEGASESGAATGVLAVKSPAVMLGYHNRKDLPVPLTDDGFYVTGDVFHRDEQGFYTFVGRADDMFVSGGENIFPGEVERMLETHPAIAQACVVPVNDDIKGTKPVAFVVRRAGSALTEDDVKQYALAHAPAYQHPRRVWFIDTLPLASTNKIDRAVLKHTAHAELSASGAA